LDFRLSRGIAQVSSILEHWHASVFLNRWRRVLLQVLLGEAKLEN
jgi:hypothetical protein